MQATLHEQDRPVLDKWCSTNPTGNISGGQQPTVEMRCSDIGIDAEGVVSPHSGEHTMSFQRFIRGQHGENPLWMGIQPIQLLVNREIICQEMMCRGIGYATHAAPAILWEAGKLGTAEEQTLIMMELDIIKDAQQSDEVQDRFTKISINCSLDSLSPAFRTQLNTNMGGHVLEINKLTDEWTAIMTAKVAAMPGVEVWLDDVPQSLWLQLQEILPSNRNITCVKIGYRDSCIVMGKTTPMKIPGEINEQMADYLRTIPPTEIQRVRELFGTLIRYLADSSTVRIVMEVACRLEDFILLGYLNHADRNDFIACQGPTHHAMVSRLYCDYQSYGRHVIVSK
jgi:hypothetical protein